MATFVNGSILMLGAEPSKRTETRFSLKSYALRKCAQAAFL